MLQRGSFCVATGAALSPWWLIARSNGGERDWQALNVDSDGIEILAVFSFWEEAERFLDFQGLANDGWRIRQSRTEELVSMLSGPGVGTEGVALDPLPEMAAGGTVSLVSIDRKAFLDRLLASGESMPNE